MTEVRWEALSVTARAEEQGTSVSVVLDRRGTLVPVVMFSGMGIFLAFLAGMGLNEVAPALGVGATIAGMGGALAVARGYWASSTKRVRERIGAVMDTIGQTLEPEAQAALRKIGDGALAPESDASVVDDAELTGA